jgi:Domain of Unknown Function (DUF1206)
MALNNPSLKARADASSGSGWYAVLARAGLLAKGVSYGIVGVLAIKLALGDGGKATSRQGALQSLAHSTFGKVLLILLALGFASYAIWRFVQAYAERGDDSSAAKTWGKRAGYVGRGLIYAGLTYSTVHILAGSGRQQSQTQKAHHTTAAIFSWPAGRWIVGIGGAAIAAAALWNLYRGLSRNFENKWETGRMSERERKWGGRAGMAGHLARSVVFGLIGIFVIKAALNYDSKDAIGLDGALRKLANASYGPYLLGLTAFGLICYGLYCLVDARYRDVSVGGSSGGGRSRVQNTHAVRVR